MSTPATVKDATRSLVVDASVNRTAKRLHDPTLSNRAFAIFFVVTILIAIIFLLAPKAGAQTTYTWNTSTTGTAWLNATNWTGNANHYPGVDNNASSTADGASNDIAAFGSAAFSGTVVGINMNTSASTGVSSNSGANGSLTLGAIDYLSTLNKALTINNSTATAGVNGTLTLTGVTLNGTANTILANESAQNVTITNGSNGNLDLALGNSTNNVIQINGAGGITINSVIKDGSGNKLTLNAPGSGTLTLTGANTYTGATTINAGTLRMSGPGTLGSISGTLTVNGGILDLNGTNQSIGALNGSGGTILNEAAGGANPKTLTIGNGNTSGSFSGMITDHDGNGSGFVKLVKTGSGTETMTSTTSNYTGGTDIDGGTLLSNSSNGGALGRGPIVVNNNGILGGSLTIDAAASITVNSGGTLKPGATGADGSIAKLNTGSVTLNSNSNFVLDLNAGAGVTGAGAGTIYDQLSVTGSVTLVGGMLVVLPGAGLAVGDKFFIVLNDGTDAVSGTFAGLPTTGSTFSSGGDTFLISYMDNGDNSGLNDISLTVTAVPEPSTWAGGALALGVIGWTQRRRFTRLVMRGA